MKCEQCGDELVPDEFVEAVHVVKQKRVVTRYICVDCARQRAQEQIKLMYGHMLPGHGSQEP